MVEIFHRTKNDKVMLICEMDDNHLSNTIKLFLKNIETAKNLLNVSDDMSDFDSAIYGSYKKVSKPDLQKIIRYNSDRLQYYLGEAMLRGLNFSEELQEIFGRKGPKKFNAGFALPCPEDVDLDDYEEFEEVH